jgi:hypothetical protein
MIAIVIVFVGSIYSMANNAAGAVVAQRIGEGPMIYPALDASIGVNIQGPSVIKVPEWIKEPLGAYFMYFADHKGRYIRLAYADAVSGPWEIFVPGTLQLEDAFLLTEPPPVSRSESAAIESRFSGMKLGHDIIREVTAPHIASPDVHVDRENRRIVMFYHGLEALGRQVTRVATSTDGITFKARPEKLGRTYWRSFQYGGFYYGLAMPGQFYRSTNLLGGYEKGPLLFNKDMRHCAVIVVGDELMIFWTQVGEAPEKIKLSRIDLREDWSDWNESDAVEILRPKLAWEGGEAPLMPSRRSTAYGLVNQLRDPAIFIDAPGRSEERVYLFYAYGGESGIGVAELDMQKY